MTNLMGILACMALILRHQLVNIAKWYLRRRPRRKPASVVAPAPPVMELYAPDPGPDQCPVCGVDDLHTRRVLNVPGGHTFTVPYGAYEAHYECAQVRPPEKLSKGKYGPVDECTVCSSPVYAPLVDGLCSGCRAKRRNAVVRPTREEAFASLERLQDPAVQERIFQALSGLAPKAEVEGALRDSVRNDVAVARFTVDGHETYSYAVRAEVLADWHSRNPSSSTPHSNTCPVCARMRRDLRRR